MKILCNISFIVVALGIVSCCISCSGDEYDDPFQNKKENKGTNTEVDNDGDENEKATNTYMTLSMVSRDGMSIKVEYEMSSDVDYFYYNSPSGEKKSEKSITVLYEELKPNTKYTFTSTPYTKDGKKKDKITATFNTSSSPYVNYLCRDGKFYPLYGGKAYVRYGNSGTATGTNWKLLEMYVSDSQYVQFSYSVHEWDGIDEHWYPGVYKINNSSKYYQYNGFYKDGNRSDPFDEGTLTIGGTSSGKMIVDFYCWGEMGNHIYAGHAVEE